MAERKMLQVHFRLMNEDTRTMHIMSDATIEQAKILLCALLGSPAENQRFIFKGQLLENNNTLAHYGVYSGSTVHVVSRPSNQQANVGAPQESGATTPQQNFHQYVASIAPSLGVFVGGVGSSPVTVTSFPPEGTQTGSPGQGAPTFMHAQRGVDFDVSPGEGQPRVHGRFTFTREYMERHGGPAEMSRIAQEIATDFFNNLAAGNIDCGDEDNASDVTGALGNEIAPHGDAKTDTYPAIFKRMSDGVAKRFGAAKEIMDSTLEYLNRKASTSEQDQNEDAKTSEDAAANANLSTRDDVLGISQVVAKLPWATLQSLESNFDENQTTANNAQPGTQSLRQFLHRYEGAQDQAYTLLSSLVSLEHEETPFLQSQIAEQYTSTMAILTLLHAELASLGCSLFASKPQVSAENTTTTSGAEVHAHASPIAETVGAVSTEPRGVVGEGHSDEQPLRTFTESPTFTQRLQEAAKPRTWSDAYMGHDKANQS